MTEQHVAAISTTLGEPVAGVREPHRVALVQDWGVGAQPLYDQYDATQLAFEEAFESGLIDRPVELQVVEVEGLPFKRATTLINAVRECIRDFDPIALIGPHTSENAPVLKPIAEEIGIPLIVMSGAMQMAGPWTFLTPNGTFPDEAIIMVDHAVDVEGASKIGMIREDNLLGDEYALYIKRRVQEREISLVADVALGSFITPEDGVKAIEQMRASGAEAYVYVGFGATAMAVLAASQKLAAEGYDVPRITMSIFMGTIKGLVKRMTGPQYGGLIENYEGWTGVDQYDERNEHFMSMLDRFAKRFDDRRPMHCYTAQGYDMGNVVAHGLALAKPASRDGLRRGLEQVRRVPATVGGPGTSISFGPYDHRGYKGDYIVMRQIKNGENVLAEAPRNGAPS